MFLLSLKRRKRKKYVPSKKLASSSSLLFPFFKLFISDLSFLVSVLNVHKKKKPLLFELVFVLFIIILVGRGDSSAFRNCHACISIRFKTLCSTVFCFFQVLCFFLQYLYYYTGSFSFSEIPKSILFLAFFCLFFFSSKTEIKHAVFPRRVYLSLSLSLSLSLLLPFFLF